MKLPSRLAISIAAAGIVVAVVASAAAKPSSPRLIVVDSNVTVERTAYESAADIAPVREANALAVREVAKPTGASGASGDCDYPGGYVPCWCAQSTINTTGGCDSAEEYLEDVQTFGQPRFFVPLPH